MQCSFWLNFQNKGEVSFATCNCVQALQLYGSSLRAKVMACEACKLWSLDLCGCMLFLKALKYEIPYEFTDEHAANCFSTCSSAFFPHIPESAYKCLSLETDGDTCSNAAIHKSQFHPSPKIRGFFTVCFCASLVVVVLALGSSSALLWSWSSVACIEPNKRILSWTVVIFFLLWWIREWQNNWLGSFEEYCQQYLAMFLVQYAGTVCTFGLIIYFLFPYDILQKSIVRS